jgi:hypothetical protein
MERFVEADVIYTIDDAIEEGVLLNIPDAVYIRVMNPPAPESARLAEPLDVGRISITSGIKQMLSDDELVDILRRQRWGDFGSPGADAIELNARTIARRSPAPIYGVFKIRDTEVNIDTHLGQYTSVYLPHER